MPQIEKKIFGKLDDGNEVEQYTLRNKNGMTVELLNYGATIRSILVPDKSGKLTDVALGFDDMDWYLGKHGRNPYFGAVVGRVANRIADAKFNLDGTTYKLAKNNGENSLHGGIKGFDKFLWNVTTNETSNSICFAHLSKDGDEGYPGDVLVNVLYHLSDDNSLDLTFTALASKPTPINMANHVYFNLGGHDGGEETMKDHVVQINADHYIPVNNDTLIPIGEIRSVDETQFDLRSPLKLEKFISPEGPLAGGDQHGFDHTFCISTSSEKDEVRLACRIQDEKSGRILECYTNQIGLQFYTGNFLPQDGSLKGKGESVYKVHSGFCLETQKYPDSINQQNFPDDSVLRPGQIYNHQVSYKFIV